MLIAFGISNQQDSGLLELLRDLIGESSGSPSGRCASSASSVLSEFIDCSLTVFFGADNDDFAEVGNRSNDSGCEFDAVVGLIDFEDVVSNTVLPFNVLFHVVVDFVGSEMHLGYHIGILWQRGV